MQYLRRLTRFGRHMFRLTVPLAAAAVGGGIVLLMVISTWFSPLVGEYSAIGAVRTGISERFVLPGDLSHHCTASAVGGGQPHPPQILSIPRPPALQPAVDISAARPAVGGAAQLRADSEMPGRFAPPDSLRDEPGADDPEEQKPDEQQSEAPPEEADQPRGDEEITVDELPVAGEIITDYGWVRCRTLDEWIFHPGVDIRVPRGTAVPAVADGTVKKVEDDPAMGVMVVVELPDGRRLVHAALGRADVEPGQNVLRGDPLGEVGQPPPAAAAQPPHLHWEIRCPEGHPLPPPGSDSSDFPK